MVSVPSEDGLTIVAEGPDAGDSDATPTTEDPGEEHVDSERAALRDAFVDSFNARDLDGVLGVVVEDVEVPDAPGDGVVVLGEQLEAIWERWPGAILTPGRLPDGECCAVGWLPDEDGCWSRAALVCFDVAAGLLTLVAVPDDVDALERAEAAEPSGEELEEWVDWSGWETGAETVSRSRREPRV